MRPQVVQKRFAKIMRPRGIFLHWLKLFAISRRKRKIDFVIAGAQKGGTTALDVYLRQHPDIGMADIKELHFFNNDELFGSNKLSYTLYHVHFAHVWSRKVLGEATPGYMFRRDAPKRIREYNPAMKIIIILRNPVTRAYSQWNMEREKQIESATFWDAIHRPQWEETWEGPAIKWFGHTYVTRGFYVEQLERIWAQFPKEQTLILKSENFRKNPQETMAAVCRFLGVSQMNFAEEKDVHSRAYIEPMGDREREYLMEIYRPEIKKLERVLGWDCNAWLAEGGKPSQTD